MAKDIKAIQDPEKVKAIKAIQESHSRPKAVVQSIILPIQTKDLIRKIN